MLKANLDPEPDSFWYNMPKYLVITSPYFSTSSFGKTAAPASTRSKKRSKSWIPPIQTGSKRCRPPKGYATISEAAKLIGLSSRGLRKAYERGRLPVKIVNGGIYVLPTDAVAYKNSC